MRENLKQYIKEKLLDDLEAIIITDELELITGGYIDSMQIMMLVSHIEHMYNIEFTPDEINEDNLNTIILIEKFIKSKIENE